MCILLVEDEALIRAVQAEELQDQGYEVHEAENAEQAFALIEDPSKRFRLLITDIHMPGQHNGLDVARRMRLHDPSVPIIYTTGRTDALAGLDMLRPQDALLWKPYRLKELRRLVKQVFPLTK